MWLKATEKESDMSQHDFNIANQGFPAFRSDLNDALLAVRSTNSGTTAPSPTVAGMLWYDTTNNILKRRNTANSAWIDVNADTVAATTVRGNSSGVPAAETSLSMATLRTMLGFDVSAAASGYQKLPGGLIVQWGSAVAAITTGSTVTFPIVFPTAIFVVLAVAVSTSAQIITHSAPTTSNFFMNGWNVSGTSASVTGRYIAIGN